MHKGLKSQPISKFAIGILLFSAGKTANAFEGGVQVLNTVEVTDAVEDLMGSADAATEGINTPKQIQRPFLRVVSSILSEHGGYEHRRMK